MNIVNCVHTGLLYVNEVAFTVERIKYVVDIINYSKKNGEQFDYSVIITDKNNNGVVMINQYNVDEFLQAVADNENIASDKDFN